MSMRSSLGTTAAVVLLAALARPAFSSYNLYDLENLTSGVTINGQDNWGPFYPPSPAVYGAGIVTTGGGVNTTTVATTGGFSRLSGADWSPVTADSVILYSIDLQWGSGGYWALGYDYDNDNNITEVPGELAGFFYDGGPAQFNVNGWVFTHPSWTTPTVYNTGDWVRVLVTLDLGATGPGDYGDITAGTMNLTDGATTYTPVIFDVGGPTTKTDLASGAWNNWRTAMIADTTRGGFGYRQMTAVDNFAITIVPEPASAGLLTLGAAMLLCRKRR